MSAGGAHADGADAWGWVAGALAIEDPDQACDETRYAFRIGTWWFLVPTGWQTEISPRLPCSRLPFTQVWCLGLTNFRGDLVPVYDLGTLIEEERGPGSGGYFLMLGRRNARAGLCFDEIKAIRIPASAGFVPLYPMRHFPDDFECRGVQVEGTFFAEIDYSALSRILAERASLFGGDPSVS